MSIQSMFTVEGMTLRDWFAGQALMGLIAQSDPASHSSLSTADLAAWAYDMAQQMMARREKLYADEEHALWGQEEEAPGQPPQSK